MNAPVPFVSPRNEPKRVKTLATWDFLHVLGVINNIWLFIPLGTGLYRWFQKRWVLLIPFVMSVAIETTQYITGLGIAEFDDMFGNTMGGWIGVLVAWTWLSRKMSLKNRA